MYSVKEINGELYVIHDATGTTLPYKPRKIRYDEIVVPDWKREYFHFWIECMTEKQRKKVKKDSMAITYDQRDITNYIELAPLSTSTVPAQIEEMFCVRETTKGNNPMSRYNEVYANASVTSAKSDAAVQRDYLTARLEGAIYPKYNELDKLFNRFVDNEPKTYKDLIAAIKDGKYTIDKKIAARIEEREDDNDDEAMYFDSRGPFYGIVWDGPVFDQKAWSVARGDAEAQQRAAKDIVMTGDAAAGLAALQAFEAWLPAKDTVGN